MISSTTARRRPASVPRRARRRGSTYILVISVALVTSVISLGALALSAVHRRSSQMTRDSETADRLARAGVERALYFMQNNPRWREDYATFSGDGFAPPLELDGGSSDWRLKSWDGQDIQTTDDGPVRIVGRGATGFAQRQFSMVAYPNGRPDDVLRSCLHATGQVRFFDRVMAGIGPVSSDVQIDARDQQTFANLETPDAKNLANAFGSVVDLPNPKTMPSRFLFATYTVMANEIAFSATVNGALDSVEISPQSNPDPTSMVNGWGIYRIQVPAGATLTITNSRIDGTLLVELTGDKARFVVGDGVVWHAADDRFPALIAYTASDNGTDIELNCRGTLTTTAPVDPLSPADSNVVVSSISSQLQVTQQPAELNGVFHIIRDFVNPSTATVIRAANPIRGCVLVEGPVDVEESSTFISRPDLLSHPPLGYARSMSDTQYITNSDLENGLEGWLPVGANRRGAGTRLVWGTDGTSRAVRVENRRSAADGIAQDVTTWLENGRSYPFSIDVRTIRADEEIRVILEWTTDVDGTHRQEANFLATTSGATFSTTGGATWSGQLLRARLIICSTTSNQPFWVDNVSVTDGRTNEPVKLSLVPTTWIQEPTD